MKRWVLAALLVCIPWVVRAQGIDMTKGGPVEVTSRDGMEWRQEEQVIRFVNAAYA